MKVDKAVCTNDTIHDLQDTIRYEVILSTLVENKILAIKRDCERNEKKLKEQREQNCLAGFTFGKRIRLRNTGNTHNNNSCSTSSTHNNDINNKNKTSSRNNSQNSKNGDKYVDIEAATSVDDGAHAIDANKIGSSGKNVCVTIDIDTANSVKNVCSDNDVSTSPSSQTIILNTTASIDNAMTKKENSNINTNVNNDADNLEANEGCAKNLNDNHTYNIECNGSGMNGNRQNDETATHRMEIMDKDNANDALLCSQKAHNDNDNDVLNSKDFIVKLDKLNAVNISDANKCQTMTIDDKIYENAQQQLASSDANKMFSTSTTTINATSTVASQQQSTTSPTITNNVDIYVSDDSIRQTTIRKYSSDTISFPSFSKHTLSAPETSFLVEHECHRLRVLEAKSVSAQSSPIFPRQTFGHTGIHASALSSLSNKKHSVGIINSRPFKLHSRQNTSDDSVNVTFNNILFNENVDDTNTGNESRDVSEHSGDSRKKAQAKKILKKDKLDRTNNNNSSSNISSSKIQTVCSSKGRNDSYGFISSFNQLTSGNLPVITTSKYRGSIQYGSNDGDDSITDTAKLQSARLKRERFEKKTSSSIRSSFSGNSGDTDENYLLNKRILRKFYKRKSILIFGL